MSWKNSSTAGNTDGAGGELTILVQARTSLFGAESGIGIEPWPASPRAVNLSHRADFSEISTPQNRGLPPAVVSIPNPSLMRNSASLTSSGLFFVNHSAPYRPLA